MGNQLATRAIAAMGASREMRMRRAPRGGSPRDAAHRALSVDGGGRGEGTLFGIAGIVRRYA